MQGTINFKFLALAAVLAVLLLVPALGQAKEGDWSKHKEWKVKLAKELKLSPAKEAKFADIADKYADSRKKIYDALNQAQEDLNKALSADKPNAAKVKELVKYITGAQDKLLTSYKGERDEEMALLSAMEQGRYLEILHKWRQEMYARHGMMEHMKEKMGEKGKMMEPQKEGEKGEKGKPENK